MNSADVHHPDLPPRHLAIFAKYWEPGRVKTRLAARMGADAASRLHRCFVGHLLRRFAHFDAQRTLAIWPPDAVAAARRQTPPEWVVEAQTDGDLGQKIAAFIQSHLAAGSRKLVLVGADSPDVPVDRIERAFERLSNQQVVLGPATDGGYFLVGLNAWAPIFDNISWGTDQVLSETIRKLDALKITHAVLEPWADVDRPDDLDELLERLARHPDDPWSVQLLTEIHQALCESVR
jgi:rSAM/selenodomain-associated transferase 1